MTSGGPARGELFTATQLVVAVSVLAVGVVILAVLSSGPAGIRDPDDELGEIIEGNLEALRGLEWYPALQLDPEGAPDIEVTDGVLFVPTTLPQTDVATATVICQAIAAVAKDPATAAPLDIAGVVVTSGGVKITDCRP